MGDLSPRCYGLDHSQSQVSAHGQLELLSLEGFRNSVIGWKNFCSRDNFNNAQLQESFMLLLTEMNEGTDEPGIYENNKILSNWMLEEFVCSG